MLIKCPECEKDISDMARSCPNCGYPIEQVANQEKEFAEPPPLIKSPLLDKNNIAEKNSKTTNKVKKRKLSRRFKLMLLGLVILILGFFYPILPLLFGITLIFLCIGIFSSHKAFKNNSIRFIKIDLEKKWNTRFRVAKYIIFGIGFIYLSVLFFTFKAEREKNIAIRLAKEAKNKKIMLAQKAKKQRLIDIANAKVFVFTEKAQKEWEKGNLDNAISTLETAKKTKYATEFKALNELYTKVANAKAKGIIKGAVEFANSGDLEKSYIEIDKALNISHAKDLSKANKLKHALDIAKNPIKIKSILVNLPQSDFNQLETHKKMPKILISGYPGLDSHVNKVAIGMIKDVVKEREIIAQKKEAERIAKAQRAITRQKARKAKKLAVAKAKLKKARQKKIEAGFSAWDGSHNGLTEYIKNAMNDPDSYSHVKTVYLDKKNHLIVMTTFRGKNVYGGVVKQSVVAKVDLNGNVIKIIK